MQYYVNNRSQANGDHEVHQSVGCPFPAAPQNQVSLGDHPNCSSAVRSARTMYATANGCAYCSPACHTS